MWAPMAIVFSRSLWSKPALNPTTLRVVAIMTSGHSDASGRLEEYPLSALWYTFMLNRLGQSDQAAAWFHAPIEHTCQKTAVVAH